MPRSTAELNEHAAGALAQNQDMFQNLASRLFELWVSRSFHCRQRDAYEVGEPRFLPRAEMITAYASVGAWARGEQCLDDGEELDMAMFPFAGAPLPPPGSAASVQRRIDEAGFYTHIHESGDPIPVWENVLAYAYEALLQHILSLQDWTEDEFELWAGQGGADLPDMRSLNDVMDKISPAAALAEAKVERFPAVLAIRRPRPRENGHHFGPSAALKHA